MYAGLFMSKIFYSCVSKPKGTKFSKYSLRKHHRHEWTHKLMMSTVTCENKMLWSDATVFFKINKFLKTVNTMTV